MSSTADERRLAAPQIARGAVLWLSATQIIDLYLPDDFPTWDTWRHTMAQARRQWGSAGRRLRRVEQQIVADAAVHRPLIVSVWPGCRMGRLQDGHHRLWIAERHNLAVPVAEIYCDITPGWSATRSAAAGVCSRQAG